ncbi:MAG TPA: thymidine phosphorylase [Woeseiaceae bacterium]|jgi:thymidine phosphorylase|nr:thymidine phosphorylase [Woeseiaceae bacterium]
MLFTEIIRKKRDGLALSAEEIDVFVNGLTDGSLPREQISALAMAVVIQSMSMEEVSRLTTAMARSGTVIDWSDQHLGGPVVDKHSTGGVGDKVSFMLAPIAAACGCYVPMISGRGLGHTGGTLDKIASIPGYDAMPDLQRFRRVVKEAGCAIIGQTPELAPADRRFYSIRDVTGTVESVPLITASILAKKIAAGLDALILDVKAGSGAFMTSVDNADGLARALTATAEEAGLRTRALVTDMNEVLGHTAGNALEIAEAVKYLRDEHRDPRLDEVVMQLCAELFLMMELEPGRDAARTRADEAITSGRAAEAFNRMVASLGGPTDFVRDYEKHLPVAKVVEPVYAEGDGYLVEVEGFAIGNAIVEIGGGRRRQDDVLDLTAGFSEVAPVGTEIDSRVPLAMVHAATEEAAKRGAALYRKTCRLGHKKPPRRPVIYRSIVP